MPVCKSNAFICLLAIPNFASFAACSRVSKGSANIGETFCGLLADINFLFRQNWRNRFWLADLILLRLRFQRLGQLFGQFAARGERDVAAAIKSRRVLKKTRRLVIPGGNYNNNFTRWSKVSRRWCWRVPRPCKPKNSRGAVWWRSKNKSSRWPQGQAAELSLLIPP